jgi:LPPG:FO 2-phospho-L-lactate transferase
MPNKDGTRYAVPVVALAGGVGGAKLAAGLQAALPPGSLTVVVNTADHFRLWGLHISPDVDTVMYTLAGLANPATGWGVQDETWSALDMLARYGQDIWFRIGDKDLATHVLRTAMLSEGRTLTQVTHHLASSLGVSSRILPMCDQSVQTIVTTPAGDLDFQEYFVRHHHADEVTGVAFRGIEEAQPTPEVLEALDSARAIVFCPSNPIVSIGPILAVPGIREAVRRSSAVKVAVSPIVGGAALKGPAAAMLRTLDHEVSPVGVAAIYKGLIDGIAVDHADEALAPRIRDMGIEVEIADTIMNDEASRETLAERVLDFGDRIGSGRRAVG